MENHLYSVSVSITKDVLILLHCLLLVATKEVHLDALYSNALHPGHFSFASNSSIHAVTRSLRSIVSITVTVIPQHQVHTLALCIFAQFCHTLSANLHIPQSIHKTILEAHLGSSIDKLHLIVKVSAVVLPYQPAPYIASRLHVRMRLILFLYNVERNCCLDDRL